MASHFCKDRCFLPRLPPPDSPTPSHLPAEGAGLEPGELQRRHPGDSSNPQTLPDFSASLRPCGKKSPPLPRATSRRGPPAETLGRREYPLQTTPPLRLCAPAGKNPSPHRAPPRPCGKNPRPTARHHPAGSSRRDAGTQGKPPQTRPPPAPLRPCGKNSPPHRAPPRPCGEKSPTPTAQPPDATASSAHTHPRSAAASPHPAGAPATAIRSAASATP